MPFFTVKLRPGVNSLVTPVQNETGYSTSQLGRFKGGLFQKLGGWTRFLASAVQGIPRSLHAWEDLNQNVWLGAGTTSVLNASKNGAAPSNISPQIFTTNSAINFTTTNLSSAVQVIDANLTNAPTAFDTVTFLTPVSVGGLILVGTYQIQIVLSPTTYTIRAASNATAAVAGGAVPVFTIASANSATVNVLLNGHGLSAGQTFVAQVSTTLGTSGVTVSGGYTVTSVVDANNFSITASTQASVAVPTGVPMNGNLVQTVYGITIGPLGNGTGYGVNAYGSGPYGGTGSPGAFQTGSAIAAIDWTLDNWGQIIIACPLGGTIFFWSPTGNFTNATPIAGAPPFNTGIFVSARFQILVAYGSTPVPNGIGAQQDPLFVRWSDQSNFLNWTASPTSQAGGQRLYSGSRIIAGYGGPLRDLLWTDLDLWSMDYMGPPFIYGFNKIADNCGIVGSHAYAVLAGQVFWMGQNNFFVSNYEGVSVLPCTVWDTVFQDLDPNNAFKSFAWSNTPFDEVFFFYPSKSGGSGECDKFVKYNAVEKCWDFGQLQRSAAIDQSVLGNPIAATTGGVIYLHESGYDGDGMPINPFMSTGFFEIGDGEEYAFVDRIYPDMKWGTASGSQNANVIVTLFSQNHPGDIPAAHGPYTVTQSTPFVSTRVRGRYLSMRVESQDAGSFWRIGGLKYRFAADGRR